MCTLKTSIPVAAMTFSVLTVASYADEHPEEWILDPNMSNISFASIKNDSIGEVHHFSEIGGTVSADGAVMITIGLTSVQTMIDIRDERMVEHVFKNQPTATLTAQIDMAELSALPVGDATVLETTGVLNLLGLDTPLDATLSVMRLDDDRVLVTTDNMVMLDLEAAGLGAGVDMLQELAGLDSISGVSPVTMRLVFEAVN